MRTFIYPKTSPAIGEFNYEGCRYDGITPGMSFSVLSEGLANFLKELYPELVETDKPAPVVDNKFCCSKCGRDCKSDFMRERHEKVCKAEPVGMAPILKPSYIFWNYKGLDRTQLTKDQLVPESVPAPQEVTMTEQEASEPMPGKKGMAMIGKRMQPVTVDKDGIEWYGEGLTDDTVK